MEKKELKRIINDCLRGRKESFGRIVETFQRKIFNFCLYFLGSYEDAEDATMEIFLRIYKNLSSFHVNLEFSSWVFTIARNYLRDIARKKKLERDYFNSQQGKEIDYKNPEEIVMEEDERRSIHKALMNLPENYRAVLIFKYYMDLSYDEIAKIVRIPRNTVASMIFRGKEELRKILKKGVKNEML